MSLNSKSAIMSIVLAVASFACVQAELTIERESEQLDLAGVKVPFVLQNGDCALTIGGKAKVEQFFQPNIYLLNKNVPDEAEFFKETVDLNFDAAYGKKKFGYTAAEMYLNLRNKGVWGRAMNSADKDSGPNGAASVRLGDTVFGAHTHLSAKPLIWFTDAWMSLVWNAVFDSEYEALHSLKLGWFRFELGRGIALGSSYGVSKEGLGLYSYAEDKSAPGILAHGDILKDKLSYDLYFSRLEERCKGLSDSISIVKRHWVDCAKTGNVWRGIGKQNDVYAARLQWKPIQNDENIGSMHIEPYVFYNDASDQVRDIAPDARTRWGSYGLMFEHSVKGFEYGAEVAFNYGTEHMYNIDRNVTQIKPDANGALVQYYTNIFTDAAGKDQAPVTGALPKYDPITGAVTTPGTGSIAAAANYDFTAGRPQNTFATGDAAIDVKQIPGTAFYDGPKDGKSRFRPAYDNSFHGWMGVADMAYTFKDINLQLAVSYAYASGDGNPHRVEANKRYNGFIGLHEWYAGKRVNSMMMLDDANIMRPTSLEVSGEDDAESTNDFDFSDLQMVGIGATWKPKGLGRDITINPNILGYWKAFKSYSYDAVTKKAGTDHASMFLGTEFNIGTKVSLLKDLTFFGNAGIFNPGGFYYDMKGVPLGNDQFKLIVTDPRNDISDASDFRLGADRAYHLNCGIEYKF